jgi:outer membrane protein OmpA-like peptidoglycan-associated protein
MKRKISKKCFMILFLMSTAVLFNAFAYAGGPLPSRVKPVPRANRTNAQEALKTTNFGDRVPTSEEMVKALEPDQSEGYKARSVSSGQDGGRSDGEDTPKAVSMEITFELDSYRLTPKAAQMLNVLGESLNAERLRDFQFIIEGHTDASGSADYNMRLSRKRAQAVKSYLVTRSRVNPGRLKTMGKGEHELLLPDDPLNAKNRRVKIINVGN